MVDRLAWRESERPPKTPQTPKSARFFMPWDDDLPIIDRSEAFDVVVAKLTRHITDVVDAAYTYDQLRTSFASQSLKPLVLKLSNDCHHPAVVAALLVATHIFRTTDDEGTGLSESRGLACEIVAWQFLAYLSEKELVDCLLYEVPQSTGLDSRASPAPVLLQTNRLDEDTPLLESQLPGTSLDISHPPRRDVPHQDDAREDGAENGLEDAARGLSDDTLKTLIGMNTLEIAGIAAAKKFLSQRPVQSVIDDIWYGNVIFWESLSVQAMRKPRIYNKRVADPYARLRVPRYQKAFQIAFFVSFLLLFYAVLVGRITQRITLTEVLLYIWIAAFAYDEFGEITDAGILLYKVDFWSLWDVAIIGVSTAFVALRLIGMVKQSDFITDLAFDVLSMVALFLVPRIFSVMSLNPYFGSLIPVLKEMTKAFCKFLPVIVVLYLGFLTTFTMLARGRLNLQEMSWILVEVFFGSSYLGFDVAVKISQYFGYPLMLIFVSLTNILLITSLVSLVSNSLTEVMTHARQEYLYQYAIYVLESNNSRRLTYFMPPLNLIPLFFLRPLRLILPSEQVRRVRILVLKATHVGFIALIWAYEWACSARHVAAPVKVWSSTRDDQSDRRPFTAGLNSDRQRLYAHAQGPCPNCALSKATPINATNDSASGIADTEVMKLLQKLATQVDDLSAMVAGQQNV